LECGEEIMPGMQSDTVAEIEWILECDGEIMPGM